MIYAKLGSKLHKKTPQGIFLPEGLRVAIVLLVQFTPHVLQACVAQELQAGADWVTARPSECA